MQANEKTSAAIAAEESISSMQFFKADTTALFPEGDAERRDVLSPLVTQAFIVVLFLDLRHRRLACAFHACQRRRILHLDDHSRVRILRLDENIAEAFSGFHVGQNQPVRLAPEKPQQQAELADSDRKSTRLNSSHSGESRMPSSA